VASIRWAFLGLAFALIVGSSASLTAGAEPALLCCADQEDCSDGKTCCSAALLGLPPCNEEGASGYCRTVCTRILTEES
jgi:hypothetical protein